MSKSDAKVPLDHLRSMKKPVTKSVRISTDQEVAERYQKARSDCDLAKMAYESNPRSEKNISAYSEAKSSLEEAEDELRENSILFRFRSVGRRKYDELIKAHPITDEQREEAKAQNDGEDPGIEWNFETFPDALISECIVEPNISPAEMMEWLQTDDWNTAEQQALFQAAFQANTMRSVVEMGKG